jgi:hypothetical protein
MQYDHKEIEKKWRENGASAAPTAWRTITAKPKYYVLDMFPYPSGAGLHVGHPLGYIASDIVARLQAAQWASTCCTPWATTVRPACGTVRHPDRPASGEDHRGQHRALPRAIGPHRLQLRLEPRGAHQRSRTTTSGRSGSSCSSSIAGTITPHKARPISELIARFEKQAGRVRCLRPHRRCGEELGAFTAAEWKAFDERTKQRSCSTSAWPT